MFYCQNCSVLVASGVKSSRFVCESKIVKHPYRSKANLVIRFNEMGKRIEFLVDDPGGTGSQITREMRVCLECARKLKEQPPETSRNGSFENSGPHPLDCLLPDSSGATVKI